MKQKTMRFAAAPLGLIGLVGMLAGCGAPTKSATDVAALFSGNADSIQDKVSGLCAALQDRSAEPSLHNTRLSLDNNCGNAGLAALNLNGLKEFQYLGFDDAKEDKDAQVIHLSLRTELWLNKDLLGIASLAADKMKALNGQSNKGLLDVANNGATGGLSNIAKVKINVTEEPNFDLENLEFTMAVDVNITGIADVANSIKVGAKMIDGKIAVHAITTKDQPFEKSLLKNLEALILVAPHAGDIYLDAFFDANINSLGFADEAVKNKIQSVISTLLATSINGLLSVDKGS